MPATINSVSQLRIEFGSHQYSPYMHSAHLAQSARPGSAVAAFSNLIFLFTPGPSIAHSKSSLMRSIDRRETDADHLLRLCTSFIFAALEICEIQMSVWTQSAFFPRPLKQRVFGGLVCRKKLHFLAESWSSLGTSKFHLVEKPLHFVKFWHIITYGCSWETPF